MNDITSHVRTRYGFAMVVWTLLSGCASQSGSGINVTPRTACIAPEGGVFATAATRHPDAAVPVGMFASLAYRRDGDLILAKDSLCFAACDDQHQVEEIFVMPYANIELIYRLGDWLFLRGKADAKHVRQHTGFVIHPTPANASTSLAEATLIALRARLPAHKGAARPAAWRDARILVVSQGEPNLNLAVFERAEPLSKNDEDMGKEVGKGAAAGAAGGAAAVILGAPQTGGITLYPPLAGAMIIGGAIIGATSTALDKTKEAPITVKMVPWEDAALVKAARDLDLTGLLSREILARMAIEKDWPMTTAPLFSDGCVVFEDYAMRGILGIVLLSTPDLVLRAEPQDFLWNPHQASYTLTLNVRASLISAVTGGEVASIDFATPLGSHPLAGWREESGARILATVSHATREMADKIAMKLQRELDELVAPE